MDKRAGKKKLPTDNSLRGQRRDLLETCLSNLNDIVVITEAEPIDEPGPRIVYVNEAFEKLTGYSPDEVIGKSPRFLQGEKTDPKVLADIREALKQRRPVRRQLANYGKDGTEYWLDIDIVPIFDENGTCTHFAAIERDVTFEKSAEESINLFRTLINQSSDAIEVVNPLTAKFLHVNDTACDRLGYTREEMLSLRVDDIFKPIDKWFSFRLIVDEVKKTGEKLVEGWHVRKDGSSFPIEANVRYFDQDEGYLITIVRDVTQRKEFESQLLWKTAFFEAKVHSSLDGVFIVDRDKKILLQNQRMLELWNIPPATANDYLEEMRWIASQTKNPEDFDKKATYLSDHPDEISREEIELTGNRFFERYSAPVRGKDGTYYGRIWSFRDISEKKWAEEQIAEQANLLNKARDAIMLRDLDGKIIFWNQGAERIYGWKAEEVIGRNAGELIYARPERFVEVNRTAIDQGEWYGELQQLTKDRKNLTVEARWTLIRDNEKRPKGILSINTDITEKKKIEAQFMRAQRMESIGTLAGGIAHDLNNILGPILLSIELLRLNPDASRNQNILSTIELSAKRGADIVQQILSFARGMEGERIEIELEHLLKDLEGILKDTLPKNINLSFSIPKKPWHILGDPTQIHQVLLNLCINARDAMPKGGTIAIHLENCVLDEQYAAMSAKAKPGRFVSIEVTDSGKGISPELLDKIFEPFFTTKKEHEGTGLGLSTVMAIAKGHDGMVDVFSEVDRGTTFKVYLPAMANSLDKKKSQPIPTRLLRGNNQTILIVDDEASILNITKQTLEAFGYQVLTASNGAEGIATYVEHRDQIAAVLTDMMMPVMDGASTIQSLIRLDPSVKIIATSGLKSNSSMLRFAEAGIKHYLKKPYTANTLLATVKDVLETD